MKSKKPPEEELDYEGIDVKRGNLGSLLKQAFSAKPAPQKSQPQHSELFSPEQNVGKGGLEKYISEAKQHRAHGSNLKKQKVFEKTHDGSHEVESAENSQVFAVSGAHDVEKERVKYKPKDREKVGDRELKKVVRKYSNTETPGESVGENGLQEFISDISERRHQERRTERESKPDEVSQAKKPEPEDNQTSIVPVEIGSPDKVRVRKASEYDKLRDPIPNFEIPSSQNISNTNTPPKNKNVTAGSSIREKVEKSAKVMRDEMRNKVYKQETVDYVGGVVSKSDMPVGRDGLERYIKKEETAESVNSETSETCAWKNGTDSAQEKKVRNKELFMKISIVVLLFTALVVVLLVLKELNVF